MSQFVQQFDETFKDEMELQWAINNKVDVSSSLHLLQFPPQVLSVISDSRLYGGLIDIKPVL